MSPYAEYPKNPRSQEWGREAIEMHENGSTKNLLQMTDVYYSVCIPMPKWPPSSNFLGELKGFCFFVLGFFCLFWFGFLITTHNLQDLSFGSESAGHQGTPKEFCFVVVKTLQLIKG